MADRKAFIEGLNNQLKELDERIETMETKGAKVASTTKAEYSKSIKELRNKKAAVLDRLGKLNQAGEDAWEELRSGTEKAYKEMNHSFQRIVSKFR
jgi:chromosome segregation ATPase